MFEHSACILFLPTYLYRRANMTWYYVLSPGCARRERLKQAFVANDARRRAFSFESTYVFRGMVARVSGAQRRNTQRRGRACRRASLFAINGMGMARRWACMIIPCSVWALSRHVVVLVGGAATRSKTYPSVSGVRHLSLWQRNSCHRLCCPVAGTSLSTRKGGVRRHSVRRFCASPTTAKTAALRAKTRALPIKRANE